MSHTLIIENHVLESDLDTIRDFFENYQLAKIDTIEYNNDDLNAIVTLDGWYDTSSARNMYDRIVDHESAFLKKHQGYSNMSGWAHQLKQQTMAFEALDKMIEKKKKFG